jgi:hypothetical protein
VPARVLVLRGGIYVFVVCVGGFWEGGEERDVVLSLLALAAQSLGSLPFQ